MNIPDKFAPFNLDNRLILVTGATGHLGRAISLGIADMGGIPLLCSRKESSLQELAQTIKNKGQKAYSKCLDLTDEEACRLFMKDLQTEFDALHGMVHCAHSGKPGTIASAETKDFELAQKIQISSPFLLIQEGLPLLKNAASSTAGGASIVNIASMYGTVSPDPGIYGNSGSNNPPAYGAAKAGLLQLTRYLACHLGEHNIRINSVSPGPFPPEAIMQKNPEFHQALCAKNPLGRIGAAHEIIGPVIFLLSAASSFITGANIAVDGGWTSW